MPYARYKHGIQYSNMNPIFHTAKSAIIPLQLRFALMASCHKKGKGEMERKHLRSG